MCNIAAVLSEEAQRLLLPDVEIKREDAGKGKEGGLPISPLNGPMLPIKSREKEVSRRNSPSSPKSQLATPHLQSPLAPKRVSSFHMAVMGAGVPGNPDLLNGAGSGSASMMATPKLVARGCGGSSRQSPARAASSETAPTREQLELGSFSHSQTPTAPFKSLSPLHSPSMGNQRMSRSMIMPSDAMDLPALIIGQQSGGGAALGAAQNGPDGDNVANQVGNEHIGNDQPSIPDDSCMLPILV